MTVYAIFSSPFSLLHIIPPSNCASQILPKMPRIHAIPLNHHLPKTQNLSFYTLSKCQKNKNFNLKPKPANGWKPCQPLHIPAPNFTCTNLLSVTHLNNLQTKSVKKLFAFALTEWETDFSLFFLLSSIFLFYLTCGTKTEWCVSSRMIASQTTYL